MRHTHAIGFDRRIDLEWLDAVAGRVAAGADREQVREYLWSMLEGLVAGDKFNSARGKTVTVLSHVWSQVPARSLPLRERALQLLPKVAPEQRLGIHWAMVMATYPFAADVAQHAGKLLALQGTVGLSHLTRRLVETWGERSTLVRAAQRVVRSMVQWDALKDTAIRGAYEPAGAPRPVDDEVAELLLEALLVGADQRMIPFDRLVGHPALFPFKLSIGVHRLRKAGLFDVHRQGLDVDFVGLEVPPDRSKPSE